MNDIDVKSKVCRAITAMTGLAAHEFDFQENLSDLGIDSMGRINLILDLEMETAISLPQELIQEENFRTPESVLKTFCKALGHEI